MPKFIVKATTRSDITVEADNREDAILKAESADSTEWDIYDFEITDVEARLRRLVAEIRYSCISMDGKRYSHISIVDCEDANLFTGTDGILARVERRVGDLFEYIDTEIENIRIYEDIFTVEVR